MLTVSSLLQPARMTQVAKLRKTRCLNFISASVISSSIIKTLFPIVVPDSAVVKLVTVLSAALLGVTKFGIVAIGTGTYERTSDDALRSELQHVDVWGKVVFLLFLLHGNSVF